MEGDVQGFVEETRLEAGPWAGGQGWVSLRLCPGQGTMRVTIQPGHQACGLPWMWSTQPQC